MESIAEQRPDPTHPLAGRIVGFSYAASEDHSIWALFVLPEYEERGIGKHLLRLTVEWFISTGAEEVRLATEANTHAEHFYAAPGWRRGAMKNERSLVGGLIYVR